MSRRTLAIPFTALVAYAAACTLNPQPLPPGDDKNGAAPPDGSLAADAGATSGRDAAAPSPDGSSQFDMDASNDAVAPPPAEGGADGAPASDGGDGGDAGVDAGDASSDAVAD